MTSKKKLRNKLRRLAKRGDEERADAQAFKTAAIRMAMLSKVETPAQIFMGPDAAATRFVDSPDGKTISMGSSAPPHAFVTTCSNIPTPFGTTYSNPPPPTLMTVSNPLWTHAPPTQRRRFWRWVYRCAGRCKDYAFQRGGY